MAFSLFSLASSVAVRTCTLLRYLMQLLCYLMLSDTLRFFAATVLAAILGRLAWTWMEFDCLPYIVVFYAHIGTAIL